MLRFLLDQLNRLPRHPFRLARALVRGLPDNRPQPAAPLPAARTTRPAPYPPPARPATTRTYAPPLSARIGPNLILVVDYDRNLREGIRDVLEIDDYRVVVSSDSQEALVICRRQTIDLIVTKYPLPGIDGGSLITEVHRITGCASLPMIAITGRTSRDGIQMLHRQGYRDIIVTPFEPDELLTAIRNALNTPMPS